MKVHAGACILLCACLACCLHSADAGKVSDAMLTLVNKAREEAGAPPLQFSQELEDEAQKRADQLDGKTKTSGSAKLTGTALPRRILKHAGKVQSASNIARQHIQAMKLSDPERLSFCPARIILDRETFCFPDDCVYDMEILELTFNNLMADPDSKDLILAPGMTHMGFAKACGGSTCYEAFAIGYCLADTADSLNLPSS